MSATWKLALAVILPTILTAPVVAQKRQAVDLELAFVVDASGSIDDDETRLQRQGNANALANGRVLRAISAGILRAIAVAYVEFAGADCERLSVGWTRISDTASAKAFGEKILAQPHMYCPGGNAIADAVWLAAGALASNGFDGTRRVIDVSGDGPNTLGRVMVDVRDAAVKSGITINGLAIDRPSFPDLDVYYREVITGGPGSFVIKAENRASFAQAILKKLVREIAAAPEPIPTTILAGR